MKIQFGTGGNPLEGWVNTDIQYPAPLNVDICKPLPFEDGVAEFVYASHTLEHVSGPDGLSFLKECFRIMQPQGIIRICVPSISKVYAAATTPYLEWVKQMGWGDGTKRGAIQNLVSLHGHLTFFSPSTLMALLYGAGFDYPQMCEYGHSQFPELNNVENHWKMIGLENDSFESIICEAIKL